MISFRDLHKSFGSNAVLQGVSLDIQEGEVFFIIGQSGAGKSVLIKHLVGLLRPDAGEMWLDGENITDFDEAQMTPVRKKCAMVFQHSTLFDSMTCAENVALPLRKHRDMTKAEAEKEALRLLQEVHMESHARALPAALGDGMRKRVAIARALTLQPRYMLFDEPTTSLDPVSARRVDRLIRELSDKRGVTSVVVSHDLVSIFGIADRVMMLYQGTARAMGTASEIQNGDDPIVQQFINGRAEGPMVT